MFYWRDATGVLKVDETKDYLFEHFDTRADVLLTIAEEIPDFVGVEYLPEGIRVHFNRPATQDEEVDELKKSRQRYLRRAEEAFDEYQHHMVQFKKTSDRLAELT
jgi:hypothetical protein